MVVDAIGKSNNDVGARLVEMSGREYMVRGRGYIKSLDDIGNIVVMFMSMSQGATSAAMLRTRRRSSQRRSAYPPVINWSGAASTRRWSV